MLRYLLLLALIIGLASCSSAPVTEYATVNGYDASAGVMLSSVNLWHDYAARDYVVVTVRHGDTVGIVRRDGRGVLVETASGKRGWVSAVFLK